MKVKRVRKPIKVAVTVIVICLFLGMLWVILPKAFSTNPTAASGTSSSPAVSHVPTAQEIEYQTNKAVNTEYVGRLAFTSGLIDQMVVQSTDNNKYLNTSWDLKSDELGAIYMDYRNNLSDQNLIIYGHYVYSDVTKMFSPLEQLTQQQNYEANKTLTFKLDNNETRTYEITDVYYYEMGNQSLEYYYVGYSDSYFQEYYDAVKKADVYDTGKKLTNQDKWITLQTCVRDRDDLREIVLAKQIN